MPSGPPPTSSDAATPDASALAAAEEVLTAELERLLSEFDAVAAVDEDEDEDVRRWYLRLEATERDFVTIWLTLKERMLHYETFFMPSPVENREALWSYLLRLNRMSVGAHFAIGEEDDVYLMGAVPLEWVDDKTIDRIVGTVYASVEDHFATAMGIGHASRFHR